MTTRYLLTIGPEHVGQTVIGENVCTHCGHKGRQYAVADFMGRILPSDVGKRVYVTDGIAQVENDQQRAARQSEARENQDKAEPRVHRVGRQLAMEGARRSNAVTADLGWLADQASEHRRTNYHQPDVELARLTMLATVAQAEQTARLADAVEHLAHSYEREEPPR